MTQIALNQNTRQMGTKALIPFFAISFVAALTESSLLKPALFQY
jgi:hypothetical protein